MIHGSGCADHRAEFASPRVRLSLLPAFRPSGLLQKRGQAIRSPARLPRRGVATTAQDFAPAQPSLPSIPSQSPFLPSGLLAFRLSASPCE